MASNASLSLGTPMSLLSTRLDRGFTPYFDMTEQRSLSPLACPILANGVAGLCDLVNWTSGPEKERADAAAILDSAAPRMVMDIDRRVTVDRFVVDDQKFSGRVFDRLIGMEVQRLVRWKSSTGPGLVYDTLLGRVRRMQIQDAAMWTDAEDLGDEDEHMDCTEREEEKRAFYIPIIEENERVQQTLYVRPSNGSLGCQITEMFGQVPITVGCENM